METSTFVDFHANIADSHDDRENRAYASVSTHDKTSSRRYTGVRHPSRYVCVEDIAKTSLSYTFTGGCAACIYSGYRLCRTVPDFWDRFMLKNAYYVGKKLEAVEEADLQRIMKGDK